MTPSASDGNDDGCVIATAVSDAAGPARPLAGMSVVEFEALGPAPLAGMLLADMGASVTVVVRPGATAAAAFGGRPDGVLRRGKSAVVIDLKTPAGVSQALDLVSGSDALIEGLRPGVMERLGLGPGPCLSRQPRLVYGRMTGWGQDGPLAQAAGHDLNYVALSGLLSLVASSGRPPTIPPTVIGDAGGALGLAFGIVSAWHATRHGGAGRVVDAAIVDIVALMGTLVHWIKSAGHIDNGRPNAFEGAPFYACYECADGGFVSVAALEPAFYAQLLQRLGLDDVDPACQMDVSAWPALTRRLQAVFRSRSRDAWCALLEGSDTCFAPVLTIDEAAKHPHNLSRGVFGVDANGGLVARPAPRIRLP